MRKNSRRSDAHGAGYLTGFRLSLRRPFRLILDAAWYDAEPGKGEKILN
ncbi:MAG: hypothetical protein GY807_20255 [Gammaproteobacteria bacterium]|nr:hypothetical protein [Gammaproteobacteria bacterium]